jgi:tight adherence protein C
MQISHIALFIAMIFGVVFTIVWVLLHYLLPTALDKRLSMLFSANPVSPTLSQITSPLSKPVQKWIEPLAGAAMNAENWLTSPLRIRFSNAGLNRPAAVTWFFAAKTLLSVAFPVVVFLASFSWPHPVAWPMLLLAMLLASTLGYYLPNGVLDRLVAWRQQELFLAFPDALDLLRVCVEAGLGLDAAVERVGREIQITSQALAQEFSLLVLELRVGTSRSDALRNLALRIGMDDIDSMVSMLIQADRFGTSIADSLRVYSESLRNKRRIAAEEAAAKLPVKILMPLIFCIFPALLTVLMGPAVINIYQILMPQLSSH